MWFWNLFRISLQKWTNIFFKNIFKKFVQFEIFRNFHRNYSTVNCPKKTLELNSMHLNYPRVTIKNYIYSMHSIARESCIWCKHSACKKTFSFQKLLRQTVWKIISYLKNQWSLRAFCEIIRESLVQNGTCRKFIIYYFVKSFWETLPMTQLQTKKQLQIRKNIDKWIKNCHWTDRTFVGFVFPPMMNELKALSIHNASMNRARAHTFSQRN